MLQVEWRPVPGYEGLYSVSNRGEVRSEARSIQRKDGRYNNVGQKIRKQSHIGNGYLAVSLSKDGEYRLTTVHRIVAQAFLANPENKPSVNHLDNNPSNNALENLEWATQKEIVDKCIAEGRFVYRTNKIKPEQIERIQALAAQGLSKTQIAKQVGVDWSTVRTYLAPPNKE